MQVSGGHLLPPGQKLVATFIFALAKMQTNLLAAYTKESRGYPRLISYCQHFGNAA